MLLKFRTQQIEMLIENLRAKFTAAGLLVDRDDDEDDVDGNDDDDDGSSSMLGHGLQTLVLQGDEMAQEEMKKLGNDTHAAWDKFRALVKSVQAAVKAQRYAKHDGDAHMTTVSWLCVVCVVCMCVSAACEQFCSSKRCIACAWSAFEGKRLAMSWSSSAAGWSARGSRCASEAGLHIAHAQFVPHLETSTPLPPP